MFYLEPLASAYKPRTVETVQVWAGISYYGLTPIVTFNQYLTRHGYEVIIKEYLAPPVTKIPEDKPRYDA
jgi:hypothetical protein